MAAERDGIFAGNDPFALAKDWMETAAKTEPNDPNAMALATVDERGMPNVRVVLLKEIEADAVVFYTNFESAKGRELTASGKAALNLHWKTIRRQVRMRGLVEKVDDAQADAYYRSRPLGSRIGAWASEQSRPLASREELSERVSRLSNELGDDPDRPPFWGGFRLRPLEVEFWADGEFRLHDRFRWTRDELAEDWKCLRLNP